jgi:hypothetical protein
MPDKKMNKLKKRFCNTLSQCLLLLVSFTEIFFSSCGSQKPISGSTNYNNRRLLLRDEGMSQLCYVDITNPSANWYMPVPAGRDLQLVGNGRVLIGTGSGYEEREISTGKKLYELTSHPGTIAARRLRNGNTLLTALNVQEKKGIVLIEINQAGTLQRIINYPAFNYVRLVRETASGNFIITADNIVFEGNDKGDIIWQAKIAATVQPHSWQALRLANGQTVVSTGFSKNFQFFGVDGKLVDSIGAAAEVHPHFFAGFQILANGNYVVTNWQGHGPKFGASGIQVLEFKPDGSLAWSWKQDETKFSSLQGIIVLDGLDLNFLHIEDVNGKLAAVKTPGQ